MYTEISYSENSSSILCRVLRYWSKFPVSHNRIFVLQGTWAYGSAWTLPRYHIYTRPEIKYPIRFEHSRALTNVESQDSDAIYVHECVFVAAHISARPVRHREALKCASVCPQCSLFYFFFFIAAFFMALFFIALFFFIDFFIDLAMMFECGGL